jgi:SAM-dependent methyltransferase
MDYSGFDRLNYPVLPVREGYSQWATTYEDSVQNEMDIRLLSNIKSIAWNKIDRALDFACGTGRIGAWLKLQGVDKIDGVDITIEMLSKAGEKNVYGELINRDVSDTGLKDESYDLTIQVLADEHLTELSPVYLEASRITRKGGYFVIVGYHSFFLMNGLITHFHKENGDAVGIESHVHLFSDHFKAATKSNFTLLEMDEGIINEAWLIKKPKWEKYKNWPVSFAMVWQKNKSL